MRDSPSPLAERQDTEGLTRVDAVFPSGAVLPANVLKFYVQFSARMSEGWAGSSIQLIDASSGNLCENALFKGRFETWDRARRRLTVLMDPGRIKRGLQPAEKSGLAVNEGARIALRISRGMRDGAGRSLADDCEQQYYVGPPIRTRVDPRKWVVHAPTAGSKDPLVVEFDRALDHALVARGIVPLDEAGEEVRGLVRIGPSERSYSLHPHLAWAQGSVSLIVNRAIEDLAGNSIARVFDRDLAEHGERTISDRENVSLRIRLR